MEAKGTPVFEGNIVDGWTVVTTGIDDVVVVADVIELGGKRVVVVVVVVVVVRDGMIRGSIEKDNPPLVEKGENVEDVEEDVTNGREISPIGGEESMVKEETPFRVSVSGLSAAET